MRIVYLITRADAVGGASIHVRDLARAMRERGHDARVLVGGQGPVTQQLEAAGVPFVPLRWLSRKVNPLSSALAVREVARALQRIDPDLVSTHTAMAGFVGGAACRMLSAPSIHTPHGWPTAERMSTRMSLLYGAAEKLAGRWRRKIICVCEYEKRVALERGFAPQGKLVVVHNGVRDVGAELRARPERSPARICSVARFEAPKDHATLVRALAALRDQPWQLDLAGDGPQQENVRRLAKELGLDSRIRFHGYVPDPAGLLAECQIFALASTSEAFPRSILEALRAGLPVAATDVGGVGEAIQQGVIGLLAEQGSPEKFASVLRQLLTDADLRAKMGAAARARYEERFRLETMVERTAAVYATVQDGTARAAPRI